MQNRKNSQKIVKNSGKKLVPVGTTPKAALDFHDFADKLKHIIPGSICYTAVPKPKADFVREALRKNKVKSELSNIDDYLVLSTTCDELFTNIKENSYCVFIAEIELATTGQSYNLLWFSFSKGITTCKSACKSHEVITKMKKVVSGGGGVVNVWSSFQKVSEYTYKNPSITALKYGREMEGHAAEKFKEVFFGKEHKNLSVKRCGLFLIKPNPLFIVTKALPIVMFHFHI